jgi:hypothetical protein
MGAVGFMYRCLATSVTAETGRRGGAVVGVDGRGRVARHWYRGCHVSLPVSVTWLPPSSVLEITMSRVRPGYY